MIVIIYLQRGATYRTQRTDFVQTSRSRQTDRQTDRPRLLTREVMTVVVYLQRGASYRTQRIDFVLTSRSRQTDTADTGGNNCCCLLSEGRHLQDTENRLRTNISEQKSLNEAAIHADLDQKAKKLDEKVKVCYLMDRVKIG